MGSVIVLIIIAYLIKHGMSQGHGLNGISDIGKIIGVVCAVLFVISLMSSPALWALVGVALVAVSILIAQRIRADKRSEMYGWNTEEYKQKYSECLKKFKNAYESAAREHGSYTGMTETQRRAATLENEKRAEESAREEADAYMRSKYGDPQAKATASKKTASKKTASEKRADSKENVYSGKGAYSSKAQSAADKKKEKEFRNSLKSRVLPKAVNKRQKIIAEFSEKYDLNLTEEQVKRIADASYMSPAWKKEVEDMTEKYDAVYQWITGDTAYLRAYLRVFSVQDVTSDFKQQMQIVMDSFEEVFDFSDSIATLSIDQRIERINGKFMTNFDEITYMIAYRYLESLGLHHKLDKTQLNRVDDTFDDLVQKYENMSDKEADDALKEHKVSTQN